MANSRLKRIAGASLLIALAVSCGQKDKPIPTEPKARGEFLSSAKLTPDERNLINRFSARLDAQAAAGAASPLSPPSPWRSRFLAADFICAARRSIPSPPCS